MEELSELNCGDILTGKTNWTHTGADYQPKWDRATDSIPSKAEWKDDGVGPSLEKQAAAASRVFAARETAKVGGEETELKKSKRSRAEEENRRDTRTEEEEQLAKIRIRDGKWLKPSEL